MELHEILERNKELFPVFQECIETITKHVDRIKELEELLYELYTEQRAYDERVAIAMDTCFAVDRAQDKVAHYLRNDALFSKLKRPEGVSDDSYFKYFTRLHDWGRVICSCFCSK